MIPLLSILLVACSGETAAPAPPLTVQAETVAVEALSNQILTTAVLEAEAWQPLYFQQSGVVASVAVTEGDVITDGQRLANLDLQSQNNQVALYEVQLRSAELDLQQASRELAQAKTIASRGGYSPEQVRDREQRVEEAELTVEKARLNHRSQLIKREQMILRAPFGGRISEVNIRVGEQVRGDVSDPDNDRNARPPMAAYQPGRFVARISLPESQAHRVAVGNAAQISLVEEPAVRFDGAVDWVAPAVDRDSRTVAVRMSASIADDDPNHSRVRDGSTVRVAVAASGSDRPVLTVPEGALLYHRDRAYLFVTEGDTVRKVSVTQGRTRNGRVEIEAGLTEGDTVVTTQVYRLTDGQTVRVVGEGT